jgi:hypothetical protein
VAIGPTRVSHPRIGDLTISEFKVVQRIDFALVSALLNNPALVFATITVPKILYRSEGHNQSLEAISCAVDGAIGKAELTVTRVTFTVPFALPKVTCKLTISSRS